MFAQDSAACQYEVDRIQPVVLRLGEFVQRLQGLVIPTVPQMLARDGELFDGRCRFDQPRRREDRPHAKGRSDKQAGLHEMFQVETNDNRLDANPRHSATQQSVSGCPVPSHDRERR